MFARDAIIRNLKSLPGVVLMTVLIWIYAEREQVIKSPVTFRVEAKNPDRNRLVELIVPSPDGQVHAELSGPQERLDRLREKLQTGGLQIDIPDLEPGKHPLDMSAVANNDLFVKYGQTVISMNPARIEVKIDLIDHRSVDVRVSPTVTNLDGPAIFDPPRVIVSGPKSVLDAASARGNLVAYARLDGLKEPGFKSLPNVPVDVPINDPRVTVSPTTVSAKLTVKKNEIVGDVSGIPVWAAYPPGAKWDKYKANYQPNIAVKVVGLKEMIDEVNKPDSENKPHAILDLTTVGDPPVLGKTYEGEIHFDFGKTGLKVTADAPQKIPFTVVERTSTPGS